MQLLPEYFESGELKINLTMHHVSSVLKIHESHRTLNNFNDSITVEIKTEQNFLIIPMLEAYS